MPSFGFEELTMRAKIWLSFSLLLLVGVAIQAIPLCACNCTSSCTASCVGSGGTTNCGAIGTCVGKPGCGGPGCLTAGKVKSLMDQILEQPAAVQVGSAASRAAARLTWRLTQHVEEGNLGEVYTAGTGFAVADVIDKVRSPEIAFLSREHVQEARATGAVRQGAPDLVAELASSAVPTAAEQSARSWLKAGARAVLVVDAAQKTVTVYRGAKPAEVVGQGGFADLSAVVPGWTLRVDDLFE